MTDKPMLPKTGDSFVRMPDGALMTQAEAEKQAKAATKSEPKPDPKKESKNA